MVIMEPFFAKTRFRRLLACVLCAAALAAAAGCDYLSFYTRRQHWSKVFDANPSMKVMKRLAPEDSLLLEGRIEPVRPLQEPLLLVAVSSQYRKNEIVAMRTLAAPSDAYEVFLPQGLYELYVFADRDRNGRFERDELVGRSAPGQPVSVMPQHSADGVVVNGPAIAVDAGSAAVADFRVRVRVRMNGHLHPSLDEEFFDPKFGNAGLYNPAALLAHTQGFLFGLEGYDENKTIILFVHGISGTPRDWKYFVDGMDRQRYQPLFFYYPSGLPLDTLGSVLTQVIVSLDGGSQKGSGRIVLAAHSLGGLASLSALQKLHAEGMPRSLALYVSFSTPYGGDDSAQTWVGRMPAVVPVWKDVARGSDFLANLARQPYPSAVPFYLFFSYNDPSTFKLGESSDGVVALRSQLEPAIQAMATKVLGFDETHQGLLSSERVRDAFYRLVDASVPAPGTARNAAAPHGGRPARTAAR